MANLGKTTRIYPGEYTHINCRGEEYIVRHIFDWDHIEKKRIDKWVGVYKEDVMAQAKTKKDLILGLNGYPSKTYFA